MQESNELHEYIDAAVEDEVHKNHTVVQLPTDLVSLLEEVQEDTPNVPVFNHVKFTRLTPRMQRLIKSAVSKLYYEDIQDDTVLSNGQLLEINKKRGEWDDKREEAIEKLQLETGVLMRIIYADGIADHQSWASQIEVHYDHITEALKKDERAEDLKTQFLKLLDRWINYTEDAKEAYDKEHGTKDKPYSIDRDLMDLTETCPEPAVEELLLLDELAYKIRQSSILVDKNDDLRKLLEVRYKIFNDSVETRRDTNEAMAKVVYGAKQCQEDGSDATMLGPDLDNLYDFPERVLQWLINESYMFNEAIPKETRDMLQAWGFIKREPEAGSSPPSDESQDPPQDKEDSPPQEAESSTMELVQQ